LAQYKLLLIYLLTYFGQPVFILHDFLFGFVQLRFSDGSLLETLRVGVVNINAMLEVCYTTC